MLSVIIEVDSKLTELKKVMNEETNFDAMLQSATDSAKEFGRTIDGALDAYGTFAKMGFGEKEVEELGKAAMLLSTVGEMSDSDSADFLTSTILQFNMAVEDSQKIVDSWNETSNNYAVTSQTLATALAKSSLAASTANVTFDELNGMVTAISASTRKSGNEIGNSLKTIFTRLRMSEVESALRDIGISVYDVSGDFRSATDIFAQLSTKWSDLTKVQRSYIAEQIGSKYHINTLMALINSYSMAMDAATTSANSYGSATRELATYQDSLLFKINNLKASFQDMSLAIGDSGLTATFVFVLKSLTNLADGFAALTRATDGWNIKLPLMAAGIYGLVKAFAVLRTAITGVKLSFGWIGIGLVALEGIASLFAKSAKDTDISTQSFIDNATEINNNANNIQSLIQKHNELLPLAKSNAEKQKELQSVLQQINDIAPQLIQNTTEYGNALSLNENAAKRYVEQLKEMSQEQLLQAKLANDIQLNEAQSKLEDLSNKLSDYGDTTKTTFDRIAKYQDQFGAKTAEKALANYREMIQEIQEKQNELAKTGDMAGMGALNIQINELRTEFLEFVDLMDKGTESLSEYSKVVSDRNAAQDQIKQLKEQQDTIEAQIEGRNVLNSTIQQSDGYIDDETGEWVSNTREITFNSEARAELNKATNDGASSIESLASSYDTLHEGESLSLSTLLDLIETYPEVATYIAQTNDLTLQKGEILKVVGEAQRKLRIEEIDGEIQSLTTLQQSLEAKRKMYSQFYSQVGQFMGLTLDIPNKPTTFDPLSADENKAFEANKKRLDELNAMKIALDKPIEILFEQANSSKSSKPKKETNKDAPTQIATIEALINGINAQAQAQSKLNEVTSTTVDKLESEKNYAEAIKTTNELLKGQQSELIKLNAANISLDSKRTDLQNANSSYDMQSWVDANGEQTTAYVNLYNSLGSKSAQDSLQALFDKWQALTQAIRDNREQMTSVKEALEETRLKGTKSYFELRTQELAKFDEQLEQSEKVQSRYKEGSVEYAAEEQKQIKLLADKRLALQNENNWIRKRLEANDKAKVAEKLTAEQVAFLTEKLKENSDAWYEVDAAQRSAIETMRNDYIEQAKEQISSLVESIKTSLNQEDIFNVDDFNLSVDEIYSSLEQIEGKFRYIASNESTRSVRNDIMNYANEIINIANEVSNFAQTSTTDVEELGEQINKQVAYVAELKGKLAGINQLIRERELQYSQEEAALENNIKVIEQVYDTQIKAQQEKLDLLDEEYEKEDRIKALKEINDEIDKTKADKRFSYITETGEEILTYDKARVDELEKQKDELVEQYEREDVRDAIEGEIERLQDAKDRQTQILQTQLDSMRSIHQQEINTLQLYQTNLSSLLSSLQTDTELKLTSFETVMSEGLENGTVAAQTGTQALQGVIDGWMSSSLTKWDSHISSVQSKLSALQSLYAQLASLASTSATSTTTTKTTTSTSTTSGKSTAPITYHTTGEVGEPPLKPNEVPSVLEVGEWVLKPEQIKSFKSNIVSSTLGQLMNSVRDIGKSALSSIVNKTTSVTQSPVYSFGDITVQANNPMEFMDGLRTHINSIRK